MSKNSRTYASRQSVDAKKDTININSLLCPQRFDLLAKYIYIKYKFLPETYSWPKELYLDHIRIFNGFVENDGSNKHGKEGFLNAFDNLLTSISLEGYKSSNSPLPISRDGVLLDGAHRASICMYLQREPRYEILDVEGPVYDYLWFRERGLPNYWLDAMAMELCRIKKNSFVLLVYPRAQGHDLELLSLIKKHSILWYSKNVRLIGPGPINLIRQIYANEAWVGEWRNGFLGARNKANWCFNESDCLRVFVVESTLPAVQKLKLAVRELYKIKNHSIHINDTHEEAMQMARLLLNDNSIYFMNNSDIVAKNWFLRLLGQYKQWQREMEIDQDNYCIDGSAVMAAYGIRESRDIDFLHIGEEKNTGFHSISSHNHAVSYYQKNIEDLVTDPRCHFHYLDSKFLDIKVLRSMKERRAEIKDAEDVLLIDQFISQAKRRKHRLEDLPRRIRTFISPRSIYQYLRFIALKTRFWVTVLQYKFNRPGK